MGKLVLLSNFSDGYLEILKNIFPRKEMVFSYIPSRTELGEIYFNRVKKSYEKLNVCKFNYIDIDKNYKDDHDYEILSSDVVFIAGGDDPFFIKNLIKHRYDSLLKKYHDNGGIIIGLCAGASVLSQYSIVSDYEGNKYENIHIIPWGLNINKYMYYSRFDDACSLESLIEFSGKYNRKIIAASLDCKRQITRL